MERKTEIKKLRLTSHIADLKEGEIVEIIGICSPEQDENGRILSLDLTIPIAYIHLTQRTPNEIRSYFEVSGRLWEGRRAEEIYNKNAGASR